MIQPYTILRGFDRIDPDVVFKFLLSRVTRGHSFKIHKQQVHCQVTIQSYSIPDSKRLAVRWWQPPVDHQRFVRWFSVGPPVATTQGFF